MKENYKLQNTNIRKQNTTVKKPNNEKLLQMFHGSRGEKIINEEL